MWKAFNIFLLIMMIAVGSSLADGTFFTFLVHWYVLCLCVNIGCISPHDLSPTCEMITYFSLPHAQQWSTLTDFCVWSTACTPGFACVCVLLQCHRVLCGPDLLRCCWRVWTLYLWRKVIFSFLVSSYPCLLLILKVYWLPSYNWEVFFPLMISFINLWFWLGPQSKCWLAMVNVESSPLSLSWGTWFPQYHWEWV